ncbi:MAG: iron ABC transporter substrate-binding protein [Candidatus Hadarchaeia archaeon]
MKKFYLTTASILLVMIFGITLSSCLAGSGLEFSDGQSKTFEIEDMVGRNVEVPENVSRVVGVDAGSLRLISYLNATDELVGVEEWEKKDGRKNPYNIANPELRDLESIGPQHGGDAELISEKEPHVVFCSYRTSGEADDLQEKLDVPVIAVEYGDLGPKRDTLFDGLRLLGKVLGREERAEELIGFIEEEIDVLTNITKNISVDNKPTVYVGGIGDRGAQGIESTEPRYESLKFINANNVAGEIDRDHAMVDSEQILEWNPEVIFMDEGGLELSLDDLLEERYEDLRAVKDENVYGVLPYNFYTANFATTLANSYYMGKVIYPEAFSNIDPREEADRIYSEFVGKGVYDNMSEIFGGFGKIELKARN